MFKKKVKVNYGTVDVVRMREANDFIPTQILSVVVEGQSTKRYHNTIGITTQLGKCARLLLDFLVERMDSKNYVSNSNLTKIEFNKLIVSSGQTEYSNVSINRAFSELTKTCLLEAGKRKGTYQINPIFFFNGTEKDREKLIRINLEKPMQPLLTKARRRHYENLEKEDTE